ncbi:MAG: flagellar motor switch protein FliM [Candidatus Binatia bacterium]|nr:flagellar motor switch protein FliM [Candidatus Binatia bacterium]
MAQILSQDEVDALLQALQQEGQQSEGFPDSEATPQPYDFRRGSASLYGRLPGLEMILSKFARRLRNLFVSELGKSVDTNLGALDTVLYEESIKRIPLPSSIHLVRLDPLRGLGVFVIEARLAYAMIDVFFGGTGQRLAKVEGRDFTPIETTFLGKFVGKMLHAMEEAWQPVVQLSGHYLRSEMNPYLLGATATGDVMIVATYRIDMAQVSGNILFSLPLSALSEVRDQLKTPFRTPGGDGDYDHSSSVSRVSPHLRTHLLQSPVSLQAVVGTIELSLRQVLQLRPGDVIQLGPHAMEQVELWVEGKPRFRGRGAQRNGVKVFVVSGRHE